MKITALPPDLRLEPARDPNTPPRALAAMAQSSSLNVRIAVAGNPSTPDAATARLISTNPLFENMVLSRGVATISSPLLQFIADHATPGTPRDTARTAIAKRMHRMFGIEKDNLDAIEYLMREHWWEMERDDPLIELCLSIFKN